MRIGSTDWGKANTWDRTVNMSVGSIHGDASGVVEYRDGTCKKRELDNQLGTIGILSVCVSLLISPLAPRFPCLLSLSLSRTPPSLSLTLSFDLSFDLSFF